MATSDLTKTDSQLAARCAAIASLGAGAVHVAVTPMHWRDWMLSGVFFAVLAIFQVLWAFLAWLRPGALVLAAGTAANVGAIALWVTSCVAGLPFGPSAGQPETVGAAGISVLLLQCYVIMGAGWAWARIYQPDEVSGLGRAFVLVGANTIMAGAVTVGLVASLQGHHNHHHGVATEAQGDHHATRDAHGQAGHTQGGAHTDPGVHMPTSAPAPVPVEGLPVTDMSRDAGQSVPAVVVPPAPAATPKPQLPVADSEPAADGHQHHHDD